MKRPKGQPTQRVLPATLACQTKTELGKRKGGMYFRGNGLATAAGSVKAHASLTAAVKVKVHACVRACAGLPTSGISHRNLNRHRPILPKPLIATRTFGDDMARSQL
ncbi:unnamed protein product [Ectocarpus fasciculatus]